MWRNMTCKYDSTAILLFSSVFWLIESFPEFEDIATSIKKHQDNNTAYKNGDPCKYAGASIEADVTAHNLVKVKWKIELQGYCQINKMEVKMFEKYSRKCLLLLVLYKRMKISKNVETDNCRERKRIRVKSLASGEVFQFWRHSSVHVQGIIVTSHGKINMNDGNDSSSNLIDTLANAMEIRTTCYEDCKKDNFVYSGIRTLNVDEEKCDKWSESKEYPKNGKYSSCYRGKDELQKGAWCPSGQYHFKYCEIYFCSDYPRYSCVRYVETSSTKNSITGKFRSYMTFSRRYLIMLFDVAVDNCIDFVMHGEIEHSSNYLSLAAACGKKGNAKSLFADNKYIIFTFTVLNPDSKYEIYIIPFYEKNKESKVAYYSERTKKIKPGPVTNANVNAENCTSRIRVNWEAPTKGDVENYKILLTENNIERAYHTVNKKSVKFNNLKANTEYCVTITAINNGGSSPVSEEFCEETSDIDPDSVTEVTVQPLNSNLKISWESPKIYIGNDEYKIILKENNKIIHDQIVKDKSYTFENLTECTEYCVTIMAMNDCGSSLVSKVVCGRTFARGGGHITLGKIQNFHNLSRNIAWSHITEKCVDYYNVRYWKKNNKNNCYELIKTSKPWLNLEQLPPNTQFEVQVEAILKHTISGQSSSISNTESFQTGTFEDTIRVTNVTIKHVSSSILNVTWKKPDIYFNSEIRNYKVELMVNYETIHTYNVKKYKPAILDKLNECMEYCVKITAINKCRILESGDYCEKTFPRGKGHITLGKIQNGPNLYRNISWSSSWSANCIDYYIVIFYMQDNKLDSRKEVHTNETIFYLDDLFPNKQYEIQVEAIFRTEFGKLNVPSNVHSFYTGNLEGMNMPLIRFLCVLVTFSMIYGLICASLWVAKNRRCCFITK